MKIKHKKAFGLISFGAGIIAPIAVFAVMIASPSIDTKAAVFNSEADPDISSMINQFADYQYAQSHGGSLTLDENDAKAIDINQNATPAQRSEAEVFYTYPLTASPRLKSLTYAGGVKTAFDTAYGEGLVPLVTELLGQSNYNNASHAELDKYWPSSDDAKSVYQYPRPYCRLPGQINPQDGTGCPNTYGFPSGHTKTAWTEGVGVAIMLPELAPQILARTAEISNGRVIVGAHYPLDVMASRAIATRWIAYRMHDDTWKAKFDAARTQLRAAIASKCGTATVAECVAANPPTKSNADSITISRDMLTYGFTKIYPSGASFQAPDYSYELLEYAFPTKTQAEKEAILTSTAIDSGYPLDTTGTGAGTANIGWTRLDLGSALTYTDTPSDTTPPTTGITAPANAATVSGTVSISANATDAVGVTNVEFYQGATLLGTDTTSPYSYNWDTTGVANGNYTLTTKAFDAAGNSSTSAGVTVAVNSTGTSPQPVTQVSTPVADSSKPATISVSSVCDNITSNEVADSVQLPSDQSLLLGAKFSISCGVQGGTSQVAINLGKIIDTKKLKVYKLNGTDLADITSVVSIKIIGSATVIEYTLTDGGFGDEDEAANSVIADPIYVSQTIQTDGSATNTGTAVLAQTGSNIAVPVGFALLMVALATLGLVTYKKRLQ